MNPASLLQSRDVYRKLFEQAGDAALLMAPDASGEWTILDANETALALHGYRRDELVGQPLSLLDPHVTPEFLAEAHTSLRDGHVELLEVVHRRKDGTLFPLEVRTSLVTVDDTEVIFSVERDITARKQAEEELRHSRDLMSYVIGHARSAIAVHDRELKYIYVSERYLKEYGIREQDVIGQHHYDVFPDLPQKWRDVHQRALRGEVCSSDEDVYPRDDGTEEWTRWECRPWYQADGGIGGIIVYTEVITDRVRAQAEKEALQAQLQQAMKMEAVGRLAGGVAHDFNNLLTSITGNVELSLADLSADNPTAEVLRDIGKAADSAASLTRQLLTFSRKQLLEPRLVDLNDLISDVRSMLARLIGEDITLTLDLAGDLGVVRIDPWQIQQVIVNLSVNGRDAMPDGGELLIRTSNVTVGAEGHPRLPDMPPGRYVSVSVRDTGHGMDASVLEHIFEPFFTTKGRGRGTGLGLASVFGAITQADGYLDVDSTVGRGTTMTVFLPRLDASPERLERGAPATASPRGTETVLVAEDDDLVRDLIVRILERAGYTVLSAASGEEAMVIAQDHPGSIDLLLTDVVMTGMNGRELADALTGIRPDTAVLYASGYTDDIIVERGIVGSDVNFINKPFPPRELAVRVRAVLDDR